MLASCRNPFVRVSRSGVETTVWGQVRPRSGAQPFRLQERRFGAWQWLGPSRVTAANGSFRIQVRAGKDTRLRIWSPQDAMYGNTLRVK